MELPLCNGKYYYYACIIHVSIEMVMAVVVLHSLGILHIRLLFIVFAFLIRNETLLEIFVEATKDY